MERATQNDDSLTAELSLASYLLVINQLVQASDQGESAKRQNLAGGGRSTVPAQNASPAAFKVKTPVA